MGHTRRYLRNSTEELEDNKNLTEQQRTYFNDELNQTKKRIKQHKNSNCYKMIRNSVQMDPKAFRKCSENENNMWAISFGIRSILPPLYEK